MTSATQSRGLTSLGRAGDVILVEQQQVDANNNFVPVEYYGEYYDAIKAATAEGVSSLSSLRATAVAISTIPRMATRSRSIARTQGRSLSAPGRRRTALTQAVRPNTEHWGSATTARG